MTLIDRLTIAKLADLPTKEIAARLGVSERTVQRALNELRDSGTPVAHGRDRLPIRPIVHGTDGYRRGCRCPECRAANSRNMKDQRVKRKARGLPPGDPRHGTDNGAANWGCSCAECRAAYVRRNRKQAANRRAKLDQK